MPESTKMYLQVINISTKLWMTNSNILISYSLKENFAIMYGIMHKVSRMEYS